jgi:prefoldin subunit 5
LSQTINFIDNEVNKLQALISKTEREITDLEKIILAKTQAIGKWNEMIDALSADKDTLNG